LVVALNTGTVLGAARPAAGGALDLAPGSAKAEERRSDLHSELHRAESGVARTGGGRTESDFRGLCDGLLKRLESERARVAALLDHEVASTITMARYLIEDAVQRLPQGGPEEATEGLQNASARIRDATAQLITLSSELRPTVLDDLGVLAALSAYFRSFGQENRAVFVSPRITVAEKDIPAELKLTVFRIVEAALSNVAKHSKASAVRVFLSIFEDELRLGVEDNGVGFDLERWRHRRHGHDGCGLGMIGRWAETSGGRSSVESIPRHGTRIQVFWRMQGVAAEMPQSQAEVSAPKST
jgi:signal transduction histidine kinase